MHELSIFEEAVLRKKHSISPRLEIMAAETIEVRRDAVFLNPASENKEIAEDD